MGGGLGKRTVKWSKPVTISLPVDLLELIDCVYPRMHFENRSQFIAAATQYYIEKKCGEACIDCIHEARKRLEEIIKEMKPLEEVAA